MRLPTTHCGRSAGTGQRNRPSRTIIARIRWPCRCGAMPRRVVSTSGSSGTPGLLDRQRLQQALAHLTGKVELELLVFAHQHQLRFFAQDREVQGLAVAQLDADRLGRRLARRWLSAEARRNPPVIDPAVELVLAWTLLLFRRRRRHRPLAILLRQVERLERECGRRLALPEQ